MSKLRTANKNFFTSSSQLENPKCTVIVKNIPSSISAEQLRLDLSSIEEGKTIKSIKLVSQRAQNGELISRLNRGIIKFETPVEASNAAESFNKYFKNQNEKQTIVASVQLNNEEKQALRVQFEQRQKQRQQRQQEWEAQKQAERDQKNQERKLRYEAEKEARKNVREELKVEREKRQQKFEQRQKEFQDYQKQRELEEAKRGEVLETSPFSDLKAFWKPREQVERERQQRESQREPSDEKRKNVSVVKNDWQCNKCNTYNFGHRDQCLNKRCNNPRS